MNHKKYFVFISTASILHFRSVKNWLIEIATRLKGSMILPTCSWKIALNSCHSTLLKRDFARATLAFILSTLFKPVKNVKGTLSFITHFMRYSGIVIPINLKIIKLLRSKFTYTYLVIGDAY
jgi:uncharacterized membrane protein